MPSIQDVADQINARLDQVATNTANTAQNTADNLAVSQDIHNELVHANSRLSQIDNTLGTGFANVSQGLFALIQVQLVALDLLDHNRKQNDTIICELVNSNELLCNIMRKLGHQLRLSEASLKSIERVEGITERVHCCEAADYDRNRALIRQMKECCPPEPIPEEECPEVCKAPIFRERQPTGQDWKPLPTPQRPDPVG
ncbi:MAG: hypothetical protein ACREXK_07930 [Gammaproteobacteria bacterium]